MGPTLVYNDFSSASLMKSLAMGFIPAMPKVKFGLVDVRDVAQGHLRAIKVPEARNLRIILTLKTQSFKDISTILKKQLGDGYPIKTEEMGACPPGNARFEALWDWDFEVDNSKSKEILGITYHNIEDTLREMTEGMIENGCLPDLRAKAA
jgi:nucleoside-diphosphate-sugar epimerase